MLSSPLLVINGIDFTTNIVFGSWSVIDESVYEKWVDGNYITHNELKRKKINGTFSVRFFDLEKYESFFNAINNTTRDNYITATVYSNNTMVARRADIFVTVIPANRLGAIATNKDSDIQVTIEER